MTETIARWDVFEGAFEGPSDGNPFIDIAFAATFSFTNRQITVPGFYDGDGVYRVRFMPDREGEWRFITHSQTPALDGKSGAFTCGPARSGVHGPVRVAHRRHFAHADSTPYFPFGTTCYAWHHQTMDLQAQTLKTLETAGFNKMRMCVFPKHYQYCMTEPLHDIYARNADGQIDFDRPNPEGFRHLEKQVQALGELGIEADLIVFHPYDRWGYCDMSEEQDYRYVTYLTARLAAYRNVWWSLANEYDFLLDTKPMPQWDRYFQIIEENDPYRHPKGIHNGDPAKFYDHRKPWVDHVCVQHWDSNHTGQWHADYTKPIINDEPQYEGNIINAWGCISARELVHRYWITLVSGGYAGHGETYNHPNDILWWSKGGVLHGESWKRLKFLRELIEAHVKHGLTPMGGRLRYPHSGPWGGRDGDVSFIYFGVHQPTKWAQGLPKDDGDYEVDLIDTWEMTVTPLEKAEAPENFSSRHGDYTKPTTPDAAFAVDLPGRPNLALRIRPSN